jgi:PAS domain S-box-containing protein
MATAQDLLRHTIEQVDEATLILLDTDGRVVGWLMGASKIFGYEDTEIMGASIVGLFTPEDQARKVPETERSTAAATGKAEDDRWMVRKDGGRFWASGFMHCLRDRDHRIVGFSKILWDRTDLRTQLDTLRSRMAGYRQDLENRGLMLGTVAHELRSPLGVLVNAVEIIRKHHPDDANLATPIQMLKRQAAYLSSLIEDILESARLQAGKVVLELRKVDLGEVVRSAIESCDALLRPRQQRVELVLPEVPVTLEADRTRLQQVLVNLISNASKFSGERARVWISAMTEDESAVVRVRDAGQGISPELLPHVFDLFAQGRHDVGGSLGIGLSLVRQYVELHSGTVAVRSEGVGRGSEFIVRLPLRQTDARATPDDAGSPST